jgi:putative oxidoreductase
MSVPTATTPEASSHVQLMACCADGLSYIVPVGRALFSLIFIMAAPGHFSQQTISYAVAQGVPMADVLVPMSGVISLIGGLSVLLGYHARLGGWLLVLFLVPVTIQMHNFWAETDAMKAHMQQIMFMKNVAMLGGALLIAYFGAGPFSLDSWRKSRSGHQGETVSA